VVGILIFVGDNSAAQAASKRRSDASRAIPALRSFPAPPCNGAHRVRLFM
jgi:hypothetical protein